MGYLAFDRQAVTLLRHSLQRAIDELGGARIDDPVAVVERQRVTVAVQRLERWMTTLTGLASCTTMEHYRRVAGAPHELPLAAATWTTLARSAGMELFTDPLGDGVVDPVKEAAALAEVLREGDLDRFAGDPAQLAWLEEHLVVVASSAPARRLFVDELGEERLAAIADQFTAFQRELDMETPSSEPFRPASEQIAAVLGLLGRIVQGRSDDGGLMDVDAFVGRLSPLAAAQLAAGMTLAGEELAMVTHSILKRWWTEALPSSVAVMWNERAPGDILLPLVAQDAVASRVLVERSVDELQLVFRSSRDKWPAEAVVLQATDPAQVSSRQAGALVPAVLTYLQHGDAEQPRGLPFPPDYSRAWLGALAGGWLLELTSRRADWDLTAEQAADSLAFVLEDDDALTVLSGHATARIESMADAIGEGGRRAQRSLEELSGMLGTVDALVEQRRIDDAAANRAMWDLQWTVAEVATAGAIGLLGLPVGAATALTSEAVDEGRSGVMGWVKAKLEREGWIGAPPDETTSRRDAARVRDETVAQQAAAVVNVTFDALVDGGRVPSGATPPPLPTTSEPGSGECTADQYLRRVRTWSDALVASGDLDDEAATVIDLAVNTMLNPGQAAAQCVQVHRGG